MSLLFIIYFDRSGPVVQKYAMLTKKKFITIDKL